ncbi:MAG: hypothetical protein ACTSQG_07985 [Promethearchaeota archaeon]
MVQGIFLYEIDKSFGPKIIADFYLGKEKPSPEILKSLTEKHINRDLLDATYKAKGYRYYSSIIKAESIKKNLYLGFLLKEGEDLISLKSLFEKFEEKIAKNFTNDKKEMQKLLKGIIESILDIMEKLKEPKIIQDKINERTKQLLDDGKLQEARELIELGEKIPNQLSQEVKQAEKFLNQKLYKKAKSCYLKAAKLAAQIQENEMVEILTNKGNKVGNLPEKLKEREALTKEIKKILEETEVRALDIKYNRIIGKITEDVKLSNDLEDNNMVEILSQLKEACKLALAKSLELTSIDKRIKSLLKKL